MFCIIYNHYIITYDFYTLLLSFDCTTPQKCTNLHVYIVVVNDLGGRFLLQDWPVRIRSFLKKNYWRAFQIISFWRSVCNYNSADSKQYFSGKLSHQLIICLPMI